MERVSVRVFATCVEKVRMPSFEEETTSVAEKERRENSVWVPVLSSKLKEMYPLSLLAGVVLFPALNTATWLEAESVVF